MIVTTIYKYKIYCLTSGQFEYIWDTVAPTVCPINSKHEINAESVSWEDSDYAIIITKIDSPYWLTQRSLFCDTVDGDITVNLPKTARCDGVKFIIKKIAEAGTLVLVSDRDDTIEGRGEITMTSLNQTIMITCTSSTNSWSSMDYYEESFIQNEHVPVSAITKTKGDILADNGGELACLTIGTNTNVLIADSTQLLGVKWGQVDHVNLANIGTNTHAQIDTHIGSSSVHGVTGSVVGTSGAQTLSSKTINSTCFVADSTVTTKKLGFDLSTATAATTTTFKLQQTTAKTLTFPDATDTVVCRNTTETLTNKTLTTPTISTILNGTFTLTIPSVTDSLIGQTQSVTLTNKNLANATVFLVDSVDNTKKLGFDTASATTATSLILKSAHTTNNTITFPNATDTVVLTTIPQTLVNKTLTFPTIAGIVNVATLLLPSTADTLVGKATTDIFTNKSLNNTSCFFVDGTTNTKKIGFNTSTAGTFTLTLTSAHTAARTITFPDISDTLTSATVSQTLTNKNLSDLTTFVINSTDATKRLTFSLGGASASTLLTLSTNQTVNNTLTFPNITDTIVTKSSTDTLLNKTIQGTTNIVDANNLKTTGASVNISGAAPPSTGQTLKATSATTATWQNVGTTTWRDIWSSVTAYVINDVVTSGGSCWICILNNTNNVPPNPTFWNMVVDGFHWKGAWDGVTAYIINDVVTSGGLSYMCILGNTNNLPPNVTYWEVFGSSTAPGGSSTSVQYNNAGSFAGAANLDIDTDGYPIVGDVNGGAAVTMTHTGLKIFSRFKTGRHMLSQKDSLGYETTLQPHIGMDKISYYTPQGNSTTAATITSIGFTMTATGTVTARNVTTTNIATLARRIGYVTAVIANGTAGIRHAILQWCGGTSAGVGGYYFLCRFVMAGVIANAPAQGTYVGMANTTAVLATTNPMLGTNACLGFGYEPVSASVWTFMHNVAGGATITKDTLTGTFPTRNATQEIFEARIYCPPNSSIIYYSLEVINGGSYFEGSATTNIPAGGTLMCPHIFTTNGAGALAAVGIDIISLYISSNN